MMTALTDIGAELVALRRSLGWTQQDLAERLGVKRQQVQRWESTGYRNANLERVGRVAEALGWRPPAAVEEALLAAETVATYAGPAARAAAPVRDLGEVVARVRANASDLNRRFGVTRIGVCGSFARGEQRPDSDVDLILDVEVPSMENVFGAERELERILGRKTEAGSLETANPRVRGAIEKDLVRVWP